MNMTMEKTRVQNGDVRAVSYSCYVFSLNVSHPYDHVKVVPKPEKKRASSPPTETDRDYSKLQRTVNFGDVK